MAFDQFEKVLGATTLSLRQTKLSSKSTWLHLLIENILDDNPPASDQSIIVISTAPVILLVMVTIMILTTIINSVITCPLNS